METVGVRELKSGLSRYLKRVRSGVRVTVTERVDGNTGEEIEIPATVGIEEIASFAAHRFELGTRIRVHQVRCHHLRWPKRSIAYGVMSISDVSPFHIRTRARLAAAPLIIPEDENPNR